MASQPISDTSKIKQLVRRYPRAPWTLIRIYIYPLLIRGKRAQMQAKLFFDGEYEQVEKITDAATIGPNYDPNQALLHYNAVEGSILYALVDRDPNSVRTVLDVGSGSGHWIDFVLRTFELKQCSGTDISTSSVDFLRGKFANDDRVKIEHIDIVRATLRGQYDVITAIGVLFHIVDDAALVCALENLKAVLAPGGVILIGGHFGMITRDIMFTRSGDELLVTKRIRSLRWWKRNAPDLKVTQVVRTMNRRGFLFPENNLLVLEHV